MALFTKRFLKEAHAMVAPSGSAKEYLQKHRRDNSEQGGRG